MREDYWRQVPVAPVTSFPVVGAIPVAAVPPLASFPVSAPFPVPYPIPYPVPLPHHTSPLTIPVITIGGGDEPKINNHRYSWKPCILRYGALTFYCGTDQVAVIWRENKN